MPTRMHQRSLAAVVPRVHIRALLQQQRHNVEVALGGGEVERGVEAAEGGVVDGPVGDGGGGPGEKGGRRRVRALVELHGWMDP